LGLTAVPLQDLVEDKSGNSWFQNNKEGRKMILRIVIGIIAGGVIGLSYSFLMQRVGGG